MIQNTTFDEIDFKETKLRTNLLFQCVHCSKAFKKEWNFVYAGRWFDCPNCGMSFFIDGTISSIEMWQVSNDKKLFVAPRIKPDETKTVIKHPFYCLTQWAEWKTKGQDEDAN